MTLDPLEKLLRAADETATPQPPPDLSDRVRRRFARQQAQARALRRSVVAAVVLIAAVIAVRGLVGLRNPGQPTIDPQGIARLRSEADDFAARADSLQRRLDRVRGGIARQDLRDEARRLAGVVREADAGQAAVDRAASIAVTEGDFSWEVRRDRADAQAAYERAMRSFPDSQWAAVARDRIEQLNMN
jgi:hypothetical protein